MHDARWCNCIGDASKELEILRNRFVFGVECKVQTLLELIVSVNSSKDMELTTSCGDTNNNLHERYPFSLRDRSNPLWLKTLGRLTLNLPFRSNSACSIRFETSRAEHFFAAASVQ